MNLPGGFYIYHSRCHLPVMPKAFSGKTVTWGAAQFWEAAIAAPLVPDAPWHCDFVTQQRDSNAPPSIWAGFSDPPVLRGTQHTPRQGQERPHSFCHGLLEHSLCRPSLWGALP